MEGLFELVDFELISFIVKEQLVERAYVAFQNAVEFLEALGFEFRIGRSLEEVGVEVGDLREMHQGSEGRVSRRHFGSAVLEHLVVGEVFIASTALVSVSDITLE